MSSDEVKKELPETAEKFIGIDQKVKEILRDAYSKQIALDYCVQEYVMPALEDVEK